MDKSSDSDEGSVRHDRFRSERFRDESNKESERRAKNRDEVRRKYSDDRNNRNRQRDRSPLRNHHKWRETHSSSSTTRRERSDHEREGGRERDTRSKSSKGNSDDWAKFSKKMSERHKSENKQTPPKKCLSSLLKSFDEKVDAKRLSENVGPALPPRLVKARETSVDNMDVVVDPSQGPSTPVHLKEDVKKDDASVSSKNSEDELNDPLPPLVSQENMVEKDSEPTISEGPALPPNLQQKSEDNVENVPECSDMPDISSASTNLIEPIPTTEDRLGPAVPPEAKSEAYGPALPPKVEADSYGPALPPGLKKSSIKGPSLPKGISLEQVQEVDPDEEEEEDEDTVGPLPEGKMTVAQFKLELRAAQIKQQLEEEKNGPTKEVKQREEWMLELPPGKAANLGLGPRSFRAREAPDMSDRSSWTDTPEDRRRKEEMAARGEVELNPADSEEIMRLAMVQERDAVMDEMSKQSREDERAHSLLDMHQKKLNKKKKKQEKEEKEGKKKKERRPFDRNVDLQVNRFDEAQKKAIFKKAQLLDTRFSTGESKYL